MEDKALGLLGLMRRAGAVHLGEDKALDAISTGKVRLLLLSADASDRARRRAEAVTLWMTWLTQDGHSPWPRPSCARPALNLSFRLRWRIH